ncbi:YmfQ family protein [Aminipila butyrica]|uniref:YmfQ family protein n=1 Tax=Aminipila butyrica TaxID=433296 RepID=A0A858BX30_9FIRM|nr:YmfQ family protein [Aminipila butyrica]QIB68646.1 YmfQ family protein [Aminipila butyrica]
MDRRINLIAYLPEILQDIREFKTVAETENLELKQLQAALNAALNDLFVESSTEYGVARWEKILKISPKGTNSLAERKFRILARLNEQLPYSYRMLARQLATLCGEEGYSLKENIETYQLIVRVALAAKSNFDDVQKLLERVVPCNVAVDLSLIYNQYQVLEAFTYGQLEAYTYEQMREEPLNGNKFNG